MEDKTIMQSPHNSGLPSFHYREDYLLFGMLVRHGLLEPGSFQQLIIAQSKWSTPPTLMQMLSESSQLSIDDQKNIQELLDLLARDDLREKLPAELPEVETIIAKAGDTVLDSPDSQDTEIDRGEKTHVDHAAPGDAPMVIDGAGKPDPPAAAARTITDLSLSDDLSSLTSDGSLTDAELTQIEKSRLKGGLIGKIVSGHVIIDRIGSGGQGDVYLAKQLSLSRYVAMKKLEIPAGFSPEEFINTFRREAQTLGSINHARIVKVFEIFQDGDQAFFTMEYISGKTLKEIVKENEEGMPLDVAANLACQALSALSRTSEDGLIHRDIKPANMLVDENGDLKIVDFGLAAAQEVLAAESQGFAGTPHFASPEQCQAHTLTPSSDQYSLGITLYYALTGKLPFDAKKLGDLIEKHVNEVPVAPSHLNNNLPRSVDRVILRMMEKTPEKRFHTFTECFDAWEKILGDSARRTSFGGSTQLLGENLLRLGRQEKDRMIKQGVALTAVWGAMLAAMVLGESVLRNNEMDWVLEWMGYWGTGLLTFSLSCIFYVAAARRRLLPTIGSLRVWLYTHIATAIPAIIMILIHSGNFFQGITPGPPILSQLMGITLVVTAISGSVGLLIFRELRRNVQL